MIDNLTVVIKTFERPEACARLIGSVRKFYPTVPIIVVDDSHTPNIPAATNMLYFRTEYDIGVSAGRNLGVDHVKTPYVWIGDDDCEFTKDTDLEHAIKMIEKYDLDIIGMEATGVNWMGTFKVEGDTVRMVPESIENFGEVKIFDFVPNIFVARTDTMQRFPWDEKLKVGEHFAHFFTNRGKLKVGYTDRISITHGFKTPSDTYHRMRRRAPQFVEQFMRENGIKRRVDLLGNVMEV